MISLLLRTLCLLCIKKSELQTLHESMMSELNSLSVLVNLTLIYFYFGNHLPN